MLFRRVQKHEKIELFLPGKREIYTIKLLKDDVHVIRSELAVERPVQGQQNGAINKTLSYHRDASNMFMLYRLDPQGQIVPVGTSALEKKRKDEGERLQCATM